MGFYDRMFGQYLCHYFQTARRSAAKWGTLMKRTGRVKWMIAVCLIALLAGCGKADNNNQKGDAASTAVQADAESASEDLEKDPGADESGEDLETASTDLVREEGDLCTQYLRFSVPEEWKDNITCHYFQDPANGSYTLEIVENESQAATDGVGGSVFSLVLVNELPEKKNRGDSEYLGTLKDPEGALFGHVYVRYPAGMQYTEVSEAAYRKIRDAAEPVAERLEGRNGFVFETGEEPEETEE